MAAQALGVESEDLAENAYAEESDADDDTEAMKLNQSEAPKAWWFPHEDLWRSYNAFGKAHGKSQERWSEVKFGETE